jgi:hypothetical protein
MIPKGLPKVFDFARAKSEYVGLLYADRTMIGKYKLPVSNFYQNSWLIQIYQQPGK